MTSTSRFRRIAAAASLLLLSACDAILPRQPDRAEAPQPPVGVEDSRAGRTPSARRAKVQVPEAELRPALEQVRRSLRRLVVAEEGFFAENGVYTPDLGRLSFRPEGETEIKFLWLDREGWGARGTHPRTPGYDCVTFVGAGQSTPTSTRYRRSGRAGVPVCDVPPTPRPPASQPPAPTPASPIDTTSALDAVAPVVQMKVDLRNLVRAQEAYHATMGVYSRRFETLPLQFAWHRGVNVSLVGANQRSWSARATHVLRPGKSCVIWFGPGAERPATDAQQRQAQRSGEPVCDN